MSTDLETRQEYELAHGSAKYWQIELELADKEEDEWRKEAKTVVERYRSEGTQTAVGRDKKFNILWSNTETLKGSLFARMAKADIRRRHRDRKDKAGVQVAILLERAVEYGLDVYNAKSHIEAAVEDYLLPGRGVVWVKYEPIVVGDDVEEVGDQRCQFEYSHWEDYRESPSKRPEDVRWKARRHLLTRDEVTELSEGHGADVPLNWSPDANETHTEDAFKRAEVWEIWDKTDRQRVYVVKGYPHLLKQEDDPYGLEGFFPTPAEPLVSVRTNESGVPIPEFRLYQDQADELDRITTRINRLVEALKRRGVYDASVPELSKLADAGDNEFIPSENFASLAQNGGLQGAFQTEDLAPLAQSIIGLYEQRDRLVQTIYEVTGISDVIRGATDPNETATAQKLKGQYGSMRLKMRQNKVQTFIRDLIRISAEIIAEHYEPHILERMTGVKGSDPRLRMQAQAMAQQGQEVPPDLIDAAEKPTWDEMLRIMRDDKLRSYHVDIETDSTVFEDAEGEKKSRIEFVNTLGAFMESALPVTQAAPELTPMVFEAMEFMVRGFKIGRTFEDTIEETKEDILKAQKQAASQPPQPDPAMIEAQQSAKQAEGELQMKMQQAQADQQTAQADMQLKAQQAQSDVELARQKLDIEAEKLKGEYEKWNREAELKSRELDIKERELLAKAVEADERIRMDGERHALDREKCDMDHQFRAKEMERQADE